MKRNFFVMMAYNKHRFIVKDDLLTRAQAVDEAQSKLALAMATRGVKRCGPKPKALVCRITDEVGA